MRRSRLGDVWVRLWMHFAGVGPFGRMSTRLATWFAPPYTARFYLARMCRRGYIDPSATIFHPQLSLGAHVFIQDSVVISRAREGRAIVLGDHVHVLRGSTLSTGDGGAMTIGADTYIQPGCFLMAFKGSITIGSGVQIGPQCGFYPYNHGTDLDIPMTAQPLVSTGSITVDDGAWLGHGVIVLAGVRIGKGAVVGAGSVVLSDVPDYAIAMGNPARVVSYRSSGSLRAGAPSADLKASQSGTNQAHSVK